MLTIQITKINYVFPVAFYVSNNLKLIYCSAVNTHIKQYNPAIDISIAKCILSQI